MNRTRPVLIIPRLNTRGGAIMHRTKSHDKYIRIKREISRVVNSYDRWIILMWLLDFLPSTSLSSLPLLLLYSILRNSRWFFHLDKPRVVLRSKGNNFERDRIGNVLFSFKYAEKRNDDWINFIIRKIIDGKYRMARIFIKSIYNKNYIGLFETVTMIRSNPFVVK